MSAADTAEYQLSQLAGALTKLDTEIRKSHPSPVYRDGYAAALADVAKAMGIRSETHVEFRYL